MDNSEASTTEDKDDISEEERNVRIFAIQMLKSRIFLGHFQERRYVEPIKGYRDVIVINDSEKELKKDIDIVRRKLRKVFGQNYWIGLTDPDFIGAPTGHCIWIESENKPLGHYWYRIKNIRFRKDEILLKVKMLRTMTHNDSNLSNQNSQQSLEYNVSSFLDSFSWESTYDNIKSAILEYLIWFFTIVLTKNNIKEAATFLSVLLFTSAALSVKMIAFLMEFSLKFMRETSYFIQSSTPVMIAVVNLIGKTIGGFYLLIVMIWRNSKLPTPHAQKMYNSIEMPRYKPRSTLTIKELK